MFRDRRSLLRASFVLWWIHCRRKAVGCLVERLSWWAQSWTFRLIPRSAHRRQCRHGRCRHPHRCSRRRRCRHRSRRRCRHRIFVLNVVLIAVVVAILVVVVVVVIIFVPVVVPISSVTRLSCGSIIASTESSSANPKRSSSFSRLICRSARRLQCLHPGRSRCHPHRRSRRRWLPLSAFRVDP